jgi:LysR family glycine cleavage system transcriptional activator
MKRTLPSLAALAAFEAAARHSSFTRASEELGLTQSAVSRQVAQLEEFLGVRLFERIRRRVLLTAAGSAYASKIRLALDGAEAATFDLLASKSGGVLHILSLATFGSHWLAPRMLSFSREHPEIAFQITAYHHRPIELSPSEVDVAIHYGEPSWPGGLLDRLMGEEIVPSCSAAYAETAGLRTAQDLKNATLLQQTTRPDAWTDLLSAYDRTDVNPLRGPRFELYAMIIEAAIAGLGIAAIPRFLIEDHLASGRLVIPFDWCIRSRYSYYLAYPEAKRYLPEVQAFRRWILREAQRPLARR